ncbi:MAG: ribose 5-phosphate isomerase B [Actinomycetota bacterium]|nr:ribose 5-phosphate isomerase B [Actinomycetota bacterium]
MAPKSNGNAVPSQDEQLEGQVRDLVRSIVHGVLDEAEAEEVTEERPHEAAPEGGSEIIAVGADHGGYPLKERIAFKLREAGHDVRDCGTDSTDSVDYPEYAHAVSRLVADGTCRWGIVFDGAGIGSAMVANKVPGVRAALCYDLSTARNSREHNHANVLTLGAGLIGPNLAWQIVQEWLSTPWGGERHSRRVEMITDIERSYAGGAS